MALILILLASALLMSGCADGGTPPEDVKQLDVRLTEDEGWVRVEWDDEWTILPTPSPRIPE